VEKESRVSRRKSPALFGLMADAPKAVPVKEESKWRLADGIAAQSYARVVASRWRGADLREQSSEITGDYHTLSVCIQPSRFSLRLGNRVFDNQDVLPGMIQLTRPALPARIAYHTPYDTLHLHVQNALLRECLEWVQGRPAKHDVDLRDPSFSQDTLIAHLGSELLSANDIGGFYADLYADSLSLTIISRVLAVYGEAPPKRGSEQEQCEIVR